MVGGLFVRCAGRGPRVVLLHGGVLAGELCWREQLRLADRFALEIVDRAGYGRSQQVSPGEDLDADGPLVAGLLTQPAHLVGHSSGAVAAMLAAALRPGAVLSLTLCEPPAFQLARLSPGSADGTRPGGAPAQARRRRPVAARLPRDRRTRRRDPGPAATPAGAGGAGDPRGPPPPVAGELPVGPLAAASFPKLVISGNHSPAFEAVCDALAARLNAQRAYVSGAGHATPVTGDAFNETLEAFICTAR